MSYMYKSVSTPDNDLAHMVMVGSVAEALLSSPCQSLYVGRASAR